MKKLLGLIFKLFIIYCCFAYAPLLNISVTWKDYFEADGAFLTLIKMLSPGTVINNFKTVGTAGAAVGSYFDYYKSAILIMGLYYMSMALALAGKRFPDIFDNTDMRYSYRVLYYNSRGEKHHEETVTEGELSSFFAAILVSVFIIAFSILLIPVLFLIGVINQLRADPEDASPPWFYVTQILGNVGLYLTVYWIWNLCTLGLDYGHYPLVITGLVLMLASRIVFKVLDDQ